MCKWKYWIVYKIGTSLSADMHECTNHVFTIHQLWQCVTLSHA